MPIDQKQLSLEKFVNWLIVTSADDIFFYRRNICETVRGFGKDKVLDELEKQSQSFHDVGKAVNLARLVRDIR